MINIREHERTFLFRLAKRLVQIVLKTLYRWRIEGEHHIPTTGPLIISSNHIHFLDPPLVGASMARATYFMAKEELFRAAPAKWLLTRVGAFPVRRGIGDKGAIKYALGVTKTGHCLTIFPEGHRSKDGTLGKGLTGVAFIARKAGCPIVPVAVIGPYRFRRPLTVRFGAPIHVEDDETNESLLEKIMSRIQQLLDQGPIS